MWQDGGETEACLLRHASVTVIGLVYCHLQGGAAKVKPLTFLLVTLECIGKIQ